LGRTERSGHLEGRITDASADARRENRLPGAKTGLTKRQERAQIGHRQTGSDVIGNLAGQRSEVSARDRGHLGERAVLRDTTWASEEQHALACGETP
jgi:hypothetical protein